MSKSKILNKNDCIKFVKSDKILTSQNSIDIHPLLSIIVENPKNTGDFCYVIPQVANDNDNEIIQRKLISSIKNEKNELNIDDLNINISSDSDTSSISSKSSDETIKQPSKNQISDINEVDKVMLFTLPINSNNFLEIVFDISNIGQLNNWITNLDKKNTEIIDIALNIFWINYYNKIDKDFETFIKLNKNIINNILNKEVSIDIINKIVYRLIKKNYGKKIKYLDKIKKYLRKYI